MARCDINLKKKKTQTQTQMHKITKNSLFRWIHTRFIMFTGV